MERMAAEHGDVRILARLKGPIACAAWMVMAQSDFNFIL